MRRSRHCVRMLSNSRCAACVEPISICHFHLSYPSVSIHDICERPFCPPLPTQRKCKYERTQMKLKERHSENLDLKDRLEAAQQQLINATRQREATEQALAALSADHAQTERTLKDLMVDKNIRRLRNSKTSSETIAEFAPSTCEPSQQPRNSGPSKTPRPSRAGAVSSLLSSLTMMVSNIAHSAGTLKSSVQCAASFQSLKAGQGLAASGVARARQLVAAVLPATTRAQVEHAPAEVVCSGATATAALAATVSPYVSSTLARITSSSLFALFSSTNRFA